MATGTNSLSPTNLLAGVYHYYAEGRNAQSGCVSTNRTPVSLVILPALAVSRLDASAQLLSWFGAYALQSTTNLFSPVEALNWVNVRTGEVSTLNLYTNTISEKEKYFRLFLP